VPRPVERDARGIVNPAAGLRRFTLDRVAPSPAVARFVELYWIVDWELEPGEEHVQELVTHPAVNLSFQWQDDGPRVAHVNGVITHRDGRRIAGRGTVVGAKFRPGGFRPFLDRSVRSLTDRVVDAREVFRHDVVAAGSLVGELPPAEVAGRLDAALASITPGERQPCEDVVELAERIVADPSITRVDAVATQAGISVRHLQRRFHDAVGVTPKWVIRRARLHEAAERVRHGEPVAWAALAAELGFSDQAHLVREFRAAYGTTPEAYARACAAASRAATP
jgi:AraC-like DNA-binding protein